MRSLASLRQLSFRKRSDRQNTYSNYVKKMNLLLFRQCRENAERHVSLRAVGRHRHREDRVQARPPLRLRVRSDGEDRAALAPRPALLDAAVAAPEVARPSAELRTARELGPARRRPLHLHKQS